jgi:hypothetical protein
MSGIGNKNKYQGFHNISRRDFMRMLALTGGSIAIGNFLSSCGPNGLPTPNTTLVSGFLTAAPGIETQDAVDATATAEARPDSNYSLSEVANKYRPFFKFSMDHGEEEDYRPCSWQWFYQHSDIEDSYISAYDSDGNPIYSTNHYPMGGDYSIVLTHSDDLNNSSDVRNNHFSEGWFIVNTDDADHGQTWDEVNQGAGTYCHATYLSDLYPNLGAYAYNLEYWVLFGYNQTTYCPPTYTCNHKADLVCIQMVIAQNRIVRISFMQHGDAIQIYDLPEVNTGVYVSLQGKDFNGDTHGEGATKVTALRWHQEGPDYVFRSYSHSDPYIYLASIGQGSTSPNHPYIFFEWGTHEPWPNDTGTYPGTPNHGGDSYSVYPYPEPVTLLDENNDAPFIFFGGKYETDPAGIMLHKPWFLPIGNVLSHSRPDMDPYKDYKGDITWPPTITS